MDNDQLIENLNDLLQTEYDAVHAYITCIKNVDDENILDHLTQFLSDHNHHVGFIAEQVRKAGGEPKARPDFKGPFLKGLTGIMSKLGDKNALRVMVQNETLTNRTYDKEVEKDYPGEILARLHDFQGDERRHKAWLEEQLSDYDETHARREERPGAQP